MLYNSVLGELLSDWMSQLDISTATSLIQSGSLTMATTSGISTLEAMLINSLTQQIMVDQKQAIFMLLFWEIPT